MSKLHLLLITCLLSFSQQTSYAAHFIDEKGVTAYSFSVKDFSKATSEKIFLGDMMFRRSDISPQGFRGSIWTNAILPIEFAPNVTLSEQNVFWNACNAWAANTPIRCADRAGETNYIWVEEWDGTGGKCSTSNASCSFVGMVGGRQEIYIRNFHWGIPYVVQHEIGHAIGYIHEHQRTDRGAFVRVIGGNIEPGAEGNFTPISSRVFSTYDFESIMHYGNCTASKHGAACNNTTPALWTMVAENCSRDLVGGTSITPLDELGVQRAYGGTFSSLFEIQSGGNCGTLKYSLEQMAVACPGGCETVGGVVYSKTVTDEESTCGFLARRDGSVYCRTKYDKDFVDMWTDSDCPHIRCGTGCLNERWTKCGCSLQTVKATCLNLSSKINRNALERMLNDPDPHKVAIAETIDTFLSMVEGGRADPAIESKLGKFVVSNFSGKQAGEKLKQLACYCEIFVAAKRNIANSLESYKLTWNDLTKIAQGMGMSI